MNKPVHVKPSFYTYCFEDLKVIALKYGYNLVIHGSMNRDMDLILIPWEKKVGKVKSIIKEFAGYLEGQILPDTKEQRKFFPHGRESYIIDMCRSGYDHRNKYYTDKEFYLDISVIPCNPKRVRGNL